MLNYKCIHLALNEVEIGKKSNSIIVKETRNTLVMNIDIDNE